ncbi:MAG TPA: Hpt domain-containing protein, partial [Polyangiaceae bacterium]|nr:Hpt domain-containing protein [Polyangiaceae bacterium]
MSFAIEDARDSLERDIGGAASLIGTRASSLLSAVDAQSEPRAAFSDMADAFHLVYGTTMLVGAASIADTATLLETLCRQGQAALDRVELERKNAQRIAALCVETADHISQVLALELAGRRPEAVQRGSAFRAQRVKEVETGLAAPPPAGAVAGSVTDQEFAFDDAPPEPPESGTELVKAASERPANDAGPGDAGQRGGEGAGPGRSLIPSIPAPHLEFVFRDDGDEIQRELLPIFHHEAREALSGISTQIAILAKDARSLASVAQLERAFHKLKGAASVLGLTQVGEQCTTMQDRLQNILDAESSVSPDVIQDIVAGTNQILTAAGLPDLKFSRPDSPSVASPELDATQLFRGEARQACERALAIAAELPSAPVERHRELSVELGKLFHHLKGSALISSSPVVAEEAGRLGALAESGAGSAAALVTKGVEKIASVLGLELSPSNPVTTDLERRKPGGKSAVEPALRREAVTLIEDATLRETILQECAELFDAINKAVLSLETSDRPRAVLAELFRQYHTLKGVVNTAGISPTGQVLHRVEDFLEVLQARAVLPSPRAIASFLLRAQADVQRQVEQSRLGYVEYSLEQIDAAIQRVSATGDASAESIASQWGRSAGSSERQAASQSVDSGAVEPREAEERRHIRVETRRLDTLMNLAGELVVSRSRLTTRALLLKRLQQELKRSNRRLVDSIDRFRDDHEFTRIGAQPMATPRADTASEALPDRMQTRPFLAQFGELELDRYDDVNVLARRLAEVTSDVSELNLEIAREVNAIVEDSDTFSTFISGIQSEVTRA